MLLLVFSFCGPGAMLRIISTMVTGSVARIRMSQRANRILMRPRHRSGALSGRAASIAATERIAPATTACHPVRAERTESGGYLFAGKWFFEDWRRIDVTSLAIDVRGEPVLCIGADEHPLPLAEQRLMSMVLFQAILIMAWLDPVSSALRHEVPPHVGRVRRGRPRSQRPGRRLHIWAAPH